MKTFWVSARLGIVLLVVLTSRAATSQDRFDEHDRKLTARLRGFEETPAISTTGRGEFRGTVNSDGSISFRLQYAIEPVPGVNVTVAHIHLGQAGVAGGVVVFFCGGGGKPACASPSGIIEGTIIATDVLALAAQGIAAGELDELLRAIRAGVTYVNVHSNRFPGGEIRGQIKGLDD